MNFLRKNKILQKTELKVPRHVAIIMDGNYRFAKSKNLPLKMGHKIGVDNIINIADASIKFGIKYLTIYAFSSENWQRPKDEVSYLMNLLDEYLEKEIKVLIKKEVKILISGNLAKLEKKTTERIRLIEDETKNNQKLVLNIAFSYGGRQEIVDAVKKIAIKVNNNQIKVDEIDDEVVTSNLYQPLIPDPDLLIRTAGNLRISNFLLWQLAYTEFYFTEIFWPDFSKEDLKKAIINFNERIRKYGKR